MSGSRSTDRGLNQPRRNRRNAETNVSRSTNVTIQFSEAMRAGSINNNTVCITVGCGVACGPTPAPKVPATVSYNDDTKTAVLNPTEPLEFSTTYTATVEGTGDGDMRAVKDRGGTPLATDYTFSFTTGAICSLC
jgi:hypothetical protein